MRSIFYIFGFLITFLIFFQTSNSLSSLLGVLGVSFFLIGVFFSNSAFFLLIFLTAYADSIKRLLILWEHVDFLAIAKSLILAPLVSLGLCFACLFYLIKKPSKDFLTFILIAVASSLLVLFIILKGGFSVGTARGIVTSISFVPLLIIIPIFLKRDFSKIRQLLIFTAIIYLPVLFYALWQIAFGFTKGEIQYMLSGLTISLKNLTESRPRIFSTLSSSVALGLSSAFIGLLALIGFWKEKFPSWWSIFLRTFIFTLAIFVSLYSGSRTGLFCIAFAFCFYWVLQFRILTWLFYFSLVFVLVLFYSFSQKIVQEQSWHDLNDWIEEIAPRDLVDKNLVNINTFSARIIGLNNFFHNPAYWTPFGALKEKEVGKLKQHDGFTRMLVNYGYIILITMLLSGLFLLYRLHTHYSSAKSPEEKHYLALSFSIFMGMCIGLLSDQNQLKVFPLNFWLYFFLSFFFFRKNQPDSSLLEKRKHLQKS